MQATSIKTFWSDNMLCLCVRNLRFWLINTWKRQCKDKNFHPDRFFFKSAPTGRIYYSWINSFHRGTRFCIHTRAAGTRLEGPDGTVYGFLISLNSDLSCVCVRARTELCWNYVSGKRRTFKPRFVVCFIIIVFCISQILRIVLCGRWFECVETCIISGWRLITYLPCLKTQGEPEIWA